MSKSESLLVDFDEAGQRLDVFLAAKIPEYSRAAWQKQIKSGKVLVNGDLAKIAHHVVEGEAINLFLPSQLEPKLVKSDKPASVIYEDDDVIVIDKPAGVIVHPSQTGHEPSVAADFADSVVDDDDLRPGVVHRLDKDTSGVMLLAKNQAVKEYIINQFKNHAITKTYLALVWGHMQDKKATIDLPIGRDSTKRTSMTVSPLGKSAISHYQVEKEYDKVSLVRVNLETGRTHQIRVHFAHIHHPVVGDKTYSNKPMPAGLNRQFLHASELSLVLPSGLKKTFYSELAADLQYFLELL